MTIHLLCLVLLLLAGLSQGIHLGQRVRGFAAALQPRYWLYIVLSGALILLCTTIADTISHLLSPDTCIFGIAGCVLTLLFYFTTTTSFLYITHNHPEYVLHRALLAPLQRVMWLVYPAIVILFAVPYEFYISAHSYFHETGEFPDPVVHHHVWACVLFIVSAQAGLALKGIVNARPEWPEWMMITLRRVRWMLLITMGSYTSYNALLFYIFIFRRHQDAVLRAAGGLTITLLLFHFLYLVVSFTRENTTAA